MWALSHQAIHLQESEDAGEVFNEGLEVGEKASGSGNWAPVPPCHLKLSDQGQLIMQFCASVSSDAKVNTGFRVGFFFFSSLKLQTMMKL